MDEHKITKKKLEQFQENLINDEKSRATIEKYMRDMEQFLKFAGQSVITKEVVICYKNYLIEHYAPASVNSMLVAVNRFLKEMGWYECTVKMLRIQRQVFRASEVELTKSEYFRLLDAARQKKDTRLYLLMQTIGSTGIRVSELKFITVDAMKKGRAIVSLKGKTRTVLLPGRLCRELRIYAEKNHIKKGSIFITKKGNPMDRSNILHAMKDVSEAAGVDRRKVFPHNLRHLFSCLYYQTQKDLSRLADLLGHSNVNTTRIYTCVSGKEQLKEIEQLGLVI